MSEIKLLPCPFCDGEAQIWCEKMSPFEQNHIPDNDGYWYSVECKECSSMTDNCLSEEEAINKWNIRKPMERMLKRLGQKEELEVVASVKGSLEEARLEGYVKGIKNAIEVVKEVGGIE
jgi:hypothetical protein